VEHPVQKKTSIDYSRRADYELWVIYPNKENPFAIYLGPLCPACECGDHDSPGSRLCEADYKCACACHGKAV
jgi:hypothetical protein